MKVILDAMGGDNAPREMVLGALDALKDGDVDVVLVGRGEDHVRSFFAGAYHRTPPRASDLVFMKKT
jgi:glycerol-3-phosphate acyltransferase PlsX